MKNKRPVTELCTHSQTAIYYRDANLVDDLIGRKTFTEVMFTQITGRVARASETRLIDAVLITCISGT